MVEPLYPLFAMPVREALRLTKLDPHEKLLSDGRIRQYEPGMKVIFISHQWLSDNHPDPHMEQFKVLQRCLRNIINGKTCVEADYWTRSLFRSVQAQFPSFSRAECEAFEEAYLWYDYFSVPQMAVETECSWLLSSRLVRSKSKMLKGASDFTDAVNSIPEYVCLCTHFFVLCPPLLHCQRGTECNFLSWSRRGWCQVEEIARRLGRYSEPVVLIMQEREAVLRLSVDFLYHPVGKSEFSCCERNHVLQDGTHIPCDKLKIAEVLGRLLRSCMMAKALSPKPDDIFAYRLLKALTPNILAGLPGFQSPRQSSSITEFLQEYHFDSLYSRQVSEASNAVVAPSCFRGSARPPPLSTMSASGWGPIFWAVLAQNFNVVQKLVENSADIDSRSQGLRSYCVLVGPGSTPLMVAAYLLRGGQAVRKLLQLRANVDARSASGKTALHWAALGGHKANTVALLEAGADPDLPDKAGRSPIIAAGALSRQGVLKSLVEAKVNVNKPVPSGCRPLHFTASTGELESMICLLDHGAEINARMAPSKRTLKLQMLRANIYESLGTNSFAVSFQANLWGATPLLLASLQGHTTCVMELLNRRADPKLRNVAGRSPLDLASKSRHATTVAVLRQALGMPGDGVLINTSLEFKSEDLESEDSLVLIDPEQSGDESSFELSL